MKKEILKEVCSSVDGLFKPTPELTKIAESAMSEEAQNIFGSWCAEMTQKAMMSTNPMVAMLMDDDAKILLAKISLATFSLGVLVGMSEKPFSYIDDYLKEVAESLGVEYSDVLRFIQDL